MRYLVVVLLAAALTGCITINQASQPTPPATRQPIVTPEPQPSPTADPTSIPTVEPPETPSGTPDPNATPRPTVVDLLPYLSSQVTVVNLADVALMLTVTLVDTDSPDEFAVGTFDVQPSQVTTQLVIPARFRLDFDFAGGSDAGTCTIDIVEGEQLQFAAIASGIAMSTNGTEPADPAEMLVATSSRCHAGETT